MNKPAPCFHCGLPVPPGAHASLIVLGESRLFCCTGCEAVCEAIVKAGLDEYYQHREDRGAGVAAQALPDILTQLRLYDRPEIQARFVRQTKKPGLQAHLMLENIRCAACIWLNEQHLRAQPGVLDVQIDYTTHQAHIRWDPEITLLSTLLKSITDLGYVAHPFDPSHRERLLEDEQRRSLERLLFSGFLGMQVMMFAFATYWMGGYQADGALPLWEIIGRWTSLIVTTVMMIYGGADFFVGAWRDLKHKRLGMDMPIVLGLVTALLGSIWGTWENHEYVYYDSIGMFIFFVLLARHLEMRGRRTAATALDRLMRVMPATVQKFVSHPSAHASEPLETVAVADLLPGDRIRLAPGDILPVDARLDELEAWVDESHLTGESRPIAYRQGDLLSAGSAARYQPLNLTVEHRDRDSATVRLQQSLMAGLLQKPEIAVLADRLSTPFVGGVLIISALTALIWLMLDPAQALPNTIAVLIITCPCALALATPVALTLSAGQLTEIGVVPLRMAAIEPLANASLFVFDKTGTLTEGQPQVTHWQAMPDAEFPEAELLRIAQQLEQESTHPIAAAICALANSIPTPPNAPALNAITHTHLGVCGQRAGATWCIGRAADTDSMHTMQAHETQVSLSCNQRTQAIFTIADQLRPGADTLTANLRAEGVQNFALLSGDHPHSVASVARDVGITDAHANLHPDEKLAWLKNAQRTGQTVVMVGDGLNDAPALAAAGAAISFSKATELAQRHSDFLILGQSLTVIPRMRQIAKATQRIIRQNLIWALAYNILAIPAAAGGLITPWMAAIGMSASSLAVVLNALRLRQKTSAVIAPATNQRSPEHHQEGSHL
ncbi:MAG: copper-translocating P-type ATPase [Halothiobacillus sp. 20-53-49]|nr:MAG: copper-translocating P-type ATPase [Halothiobacillus sp. 20-53-49]